jgi:hypothetical protein
MPNEYPNYYGVQHLIGNATTAPTLIPFGFGATYVRLHHLGGDPLYANMQQSTSVSTGDAQLSTAEAAVFTGMSRISGVSLFTTSTGSGIAINVLAME